MTSYQIRTRSKGKVIENVLISPPKIRKASKNKRVLLDDSPPVSPKRQKTSSVSPSTVHSPSILDRLRNVDDCSASSVIPAELDLNENLDDSLEAREVGGLDEEDDDYAVDDGSDEIEEVEKSKSKPKRGKNKSYELLDIFDDIEKFEEFWESSEFNNLYCVQERAGNSAGEYTLYRCRYNKKAGFKSCQSKVKAVFPDNDNSVMLYATADKHEHTQQNPTSDITHRFSWKRNALAHDIVVTGVKHNDFPSQIMLALAKANVDPLPSCLQLNNHIAEVRKKQIDRNPIHNTENLRNEIEKRLKDPEDENEVYVERRFLA